MDYVSLIDLGIALLQSFLSGTKSKLPAEVLQSVQAAVDALAAHKDDVVTKAALEAQRG